MAISFTPTKIARFVGALYGVALNNNTNTEAMKEIYARGFDAVANDVFASDFGTKTTAQVAQTVANNLGLTGATNADAALYLEGQLNAAAPAARGAVISNTMSLFASLVNDAQYGAAASAFEGRVANAIIYSNASSSVYHGSFNDLAAGTVLNLVTGFDNLLGTSGDDAFAANSIGGVNTLGDGDLLNGGTGTDTLNADLINLGYVITPATTGIETINIRAQNNGADAAQNNTQGQGITVDAERMSGVSTWSSTNSRADLIIEDVRINSNVSTIAFVQSDPGNVDLGVYFNERNLVNTVGSTSVLNIQLMDTGAAAVAATAATPLLNNPYDTFKFAANGQLITLVLPNADTADTYPLLLAAFQAAIAANPDLAGGVTAALGSSFTVTDPLSGTQVTGQAITLTANSSVAITTPTGSGWFNTTGASVPASSNIYTTYNNSSANQAALVSTSVILDDVGMGDTGGDLVIGGMSTGLTSNDKGVELFNIEVRDNSKLQTINSTNNTLREVYITNGATSSTSSAYVTTTTDAGDLTVNGTNFGTSVAISTIDAALRGTEAIAGSNQTISHSTGGSAGFTDVRVIDASAMRGKFAFTAAITNDSIAKFINPVDTQANPAADIATNNTAGLGANFDYDGGVNDDIMTVAIDANVVSSRSTVVSGQSDFTFNVAGGTGNDAITLSVLASGLAGGAQAWYNNQKLNANITINAGDGNDTIRTPGAGDVIIDAGAGDDTVYTDNTGVLTASVANGAASAAALAYSNAAAAELAAGQAAAVASNTTGFVMIDGTATGAAVTTAAAANALNTLNLVTPDGTHAAVVAAGGAIPVHSVLIAAIDAATAAGGLTLAQNIALQTAYGNWTTAGTITPVATLAAQTIAGSVATADGTVVTAAQYDAGNTLLASYIAAAKAAEATASSNDTLVAAGAAYDATGPAAAGELLNVTQKAVVVATQAVNKVFDPAAVSGLTYTLGPITQGANETNTFTIIADAAGGAANTTIINGATIVESVAGAGFTAADAAAALIAGATVGTALYAGANAAGWTVSAGAGTNVVYTSTATGNPADLADTGTTAIVPVVAAATAEAVAVTITGTGLTGETVTFDGVTHAVGGLTGAQVAALIDGAADGATFADADGGGGVLNLTASTAGVLADITAGSFVSANPNAAAGTQTTVTNLAALNSALSSGATDAAVVTALKAAINNGSITVAQAGALFTAATSSGVNSINATDLAAIAMILTPLQTAATNANTAAAATLAAAVAADATAVNTVATAVAASPSLAGSSPVGGDESGAVEAAAAAAAAATAVTTFQTVTLTPLTTQASNLAALKAAIAVGTTDLQVVTATTNAVANGAINGAAKTAIDTAAGAAVPAVAGTVSAAEKTAVDLLVTALQLTNETLVADATLDLANLNAIATATATASTIATAAANSGATSLTTGTQTAVYVFDTSNQSSTYNRVTMDDRNTADLKSDANNSNNFFNSTVKVTYKGLDASVVVAGTGYKTSDLEINQAIKQAINTDAVLSKLLLAIDGPGNSLVVTSLIDGVHTTGNLAVTVTMPTTVSSSALAGAAAAYGLAAGATEAQVLAAMTASKTAFDAKGDYATQFAESGAAAGNVTLTGANSVSSSDNTVTPGTGNDVIVLGTTVGTDLMTSSNEVVVYSGSFGADTIVNFAASGLGIDVLNFSALGGRGTTALNSLSADKSIVIQAQAATPLTTTQIAALFTDSATAISHVYVAYDSNNIGSVYMIADATGTTAGNVTATLVGTIDLADTGWATLTAANFA